MAHITQEEFTQFLEELKHLALDKDKDRDKLHADKHSDRIFLLGQSKGLHDAVAKGYSLLITKQRA